MLSRNLKDLPGNVTHSRRELARFLSEFSHRLPTPYTLESVTGGLQMRSQHWVSFARFIILLHFRLLLPIHSPLQCQIAAMFICQKHKEVRLSIWFA